jgi:hypothetical protein
MAELTASWRTSPRQPGPGTVMTSGRPFLGRPRPSLPVHRSTGADVTRMRPTTRPDPVQRAGDQSNSGYLNLGSQAHIERPGPRLGHLHSPPRAHPGLLAHRTDHKLQADSRPSRRLRHVTAPSRGSGPPTGVTGPYHRPVADVVPTYEPDPCPLAGRLTTPTPRAHEPEAAFRGGPAMRTPSRMCDLSA